MFHLPEHPPSCILYVVVEWQMKLIAIGGGGFTSETDPLLDDFVLSRAKGPETRFGFITTASDHDPVRIERFMRLIKPRVKSARHLSPLAGSDTLATWLEDIDLLYVAGGDTEHLQSVWTERNYWPVIQTAIAQGLWIAGVSAGAVIWFEAALIRNQKKLLHIINGLGLVEGSLCVHFSSEPDRQEPFSRAIESKKIPQGIAIDDGVAVVFRPGQRPLYKSARPGNRAYHIYKSGAVPLSEVKG